MTLLMAAVLAAAPARMVDGGVTEAEIVDVVALHARELSPCFSEPKGAKKKPSVKYRFEVTDGRVTKFALVDSVTFSAVGLTCVGEIVEKLKFPSRADSPTFVEWTFLPPPVTEAGEPPLATEEELAPIDALVRACYETNPLTEKTEGTLSLNLTVLRSGAIASTEFVDQSPALEKLTLADCLKRRLPSGALGARERAEVIRVGWVFATSERRAKMMFIPGEARREIIAEAKPGPKGGLEKQVIHQVIRKWQPQVRYCYEQALQKTPKLEGKVTVSWRIDPEGAAVAATISEDTLGDASVGECLVRLVNTWTFAKPEGGGFVDVSFPWIFKLAGSE